MSTNFSSAVKDVYAYEKDKDMKLLKERFAIDGKDVIVYDFAKRDGFARWEIQIPKSRFPIHQTLESKICRYHGAFEKRRPVRATLLRFVDFVNGMLLFYPVQGNG